jgi:hypothetical protein
MQAGPNIYIKLKKKRYKFANSMLIKVPDSRFDLFFKKKRRYLEEFLDRPDCRFDYFSHILF